MQPYSKFIYAVELGDQDRPIMVSVMAPNREVADEKLPGVIQTATGDNQPFTAIIRGFEEGL